MIEFAFGRVPDSCKVNGRERKILLRQLGARVLPPSLDLRRKQGFTMPMAAWYKTSLGAYLESVLAEVPQDFLSRAVIRQLTSLQRNGRANTHRIFALAMLELWRREYDVDYTAVRAAAVNALVVA
jgi:asparagine synthase (glutamine-hydrolysing)